MLFQWILIRERIKEKFNVKLWEESSVEVERKKRKSLRVH